MSLLTIYDNYRWSPELQTGWGFSCLLKFKNKNLLFDTGADSPTLLANMKKLAVNPTEIDLVFLSHNHSDHIGGLFGFLEKNNNLEVILPCSFPRAFKDKIKFYGVKISSIDKPREISKGIYSTGELGFLVKEQSLIIESEKGVVLVTGCAHPGIVNIIKKTKKITNKEIYLVMGGFHLEGVSNSQLAAIVKNFRRLGVKKAAPCHCSGEKAREAFKQEYKEDYIDNGVGKLINL